eukprot:CAMPEP_0201732854 /NCGR_PEP_ID=MMETSP0593-20130828/29982_1 /ASSEMBLY_ACC=CAM_ASM_000672 /TAXON_ID=267983 /ORGANISM="Skeletonema japonicum, Strain CCMP2506" /LENGTH=39 /DNA_ID= /DNA_START= /DNA_END= /DNA_ORIENTATION=
MTVNLTLAGNTCVANLGNSNHLWIGMQMAVELDDLFGRI